MFFAFFFAFFSVQQAHFIKLRHQSFLLQRLLFFCSVSLEKAKKRDLTFISMSPRNWRSKYPNSSSTSLVAEDTWIFKAARHIKSMTEQAQHFYSVKNASSGIIGVITPLLICLSHCFRTHRSEKPEKDELIHSVPLETSGSNANSDGNLYRFCLINANSAEI